MRPIPANQSGPTSSQLSAESRLLASEAVQGHKINRGNYEAEREQV